MTLHETTRRRDRLAPLRLRLLHRRTRPRRAHVGDALLHAGTAHGRPHARRHDVGVAHESHVRLTVLAARGVRRLRQGRQALEKSATSIHNSNDELRNRTADYFANWKKDTAKVSNPELQAIADQRRQVVRDQYDRFRTSYAGASASLDTLLKDLHDLRSVIGNDLTEATQSHVRGTTVVQSAASDGSRAQSAIDGALAETRALIQQLAPAAGQ